MFAYMAGIARAIGATDVRVNGIADHAHLFGRFPPKIALAEVVQKVKANSSKWAHDERVLPRSFGWQTGYAAFSVSRSKAAEVIQYVEDQETHHKKMTFQEELIAMFRKHGIEYDERYIWR
jgi:REP element-mobilizing transposase RayT